MNKLLPLVILLGVSIIGFVSKLLELSDIRSRYETTAEYRSKFIDFINELFDKQSFNQKLYYELTAKVKEMQCELGTDGVYAYVQDNLKGYRTNNYQLLINFLPETRNMLNYFNNSIMMERYNQEAQDCDDMFVRHLGTLELTEKNQRKSLLNPFADFAEGVKLIITLPILLLKWFGFISKEKSFHIKTNFIIKIINFIVTIVSFVSGVMAIIMGWSEFLQMIKTLIQF
jgi:hypothetical protein